MILEASFAFISDINGTSITYEGHSNMLLVQITAAPGNRRQRLLAKWQKMAKHHSEPFVFIPLQ
jgi:hypothetical protein